MNNKTDTGELYVFIVVAIMAEDGGDVHVSPDGNSIYPDVIFNVGVKGLNNFISSGIFEAEVAGIYIVAVTVNLAMTTSQFSINKNSETIAYVNIAGTRYSDQSNTGIVVTQLAIGDKISIKVVELDFSCELDTSGKYSTLTIVKIQ